MFTLCRPSVQSIQSYRRQQPKMFQKKEQVTRASSSYLLLLLPVGKWLQVALLMRLLPPAPLKLRVLVVTIWSEETAVDTSLSMDSLLCWKLAVATTVVANNINIFKSLRLDLALLIKQVIHKYLFW